MVLLFLLLSSYMVAPIGNLANKFFFSSTNNKSSNMALNIKSSKPTMSSTKDIGMDIPTEQVSSNESKVRGRKSVSPINLSRESLLASSGRSMPYHDRMNIDTDLSGMELTPELSYETEQEKAIRVSMTANQQDSTRPSCVHNEVPHCMPNMRKKLSTYNFLMTHMPPPNQSYGVDLSTLFLCMVLSNTLPRILRISK